ncbi:MAG: single-stranded-DNA-specific exonuclease RecJ [Desulfobulbus sp.]|nr:MAG: single-stranded-DNA-specific exonuclease RecJ [Desulfobulbus sp.]
MYFRFRSAMISQPVDAAGLLSKHLGVPQSSAGLLCLRGISTPEQAERFLTPKLADLPDPFLFKDMERAVTLICEAMRQQWPIVVYGDYDVDGICATSLLVHFLKTLKLTVKWHVPNRLTDGYGLTSSGIRTVGEMVQAPALLITVDNGIAAVKEVEEAVAAGFRVIVTDHHEPQGRVPAADAVINPKQDDCVFPFSGLSGAGVAFFLIVSLRSRCIENGYLQPDNAPNLKKYLDLVALGTVADVMPLVDVNRILVRAGIEVLSERSRPGIWALCEEAGMGEGAITSEDISFRLAPRINAAGRMGVPEVAARLLMAEDVSEAQQAAIELEEKNKQRKEIERSIMQAAVVQCEKQCAQGARALIVYQADWHPGVLGIVASRICDRFHLPAIALADDRNNGNIRGSGRSACGVDLFAVVENCRQWLHHFGGHEQAIGLTLAKDHLQQFTEALNIQVGELLVQGNHDDEAVIIDQQLSGEEVTPSFVSFLRHLEPCGNENPEPVFLAKNTKLVRTSIVKKEHLRFSLQLGDTVYQGIGFGMGEKITMVQNRVDLAFTIKHSCFRGKKRVEVMAVAIRPTS